MAKTTPPTPSSTSQPPYIKRAHLRNVPPLRDVQVDFQPGLNIIIGKNGSGKTNFMRLLSELIELYEEKYRGVESEIEMLNQKKFTISFQEQAPTKKLIPARMSRQLPLLITVSSEESTAQSTQFGEALTANIGVSEDYAMIKIWHGLPTHRLPLIDEGAEIAVTEDGQLIFVNPLVKYWEIDNHLIQSIVASIKMVFYAWLDGHQSLSNIELVRQKINNAIGVHIERINTYLSIYSPLQNVKLSEQFQTYQNNARGEIIIKGLVLDYKIGDEWLPFGALSDGTKRMFYIISELVCAGFALPIGNSESLTLLDFNKIIFLEEPELGIHPDQLQLLLQLIREVSKEHQVIMTTHSPQTLDMLNKDELDRITICEFIPGKGTQMRKLSPAKIAKAKAYLRDEGFLSEFWRFSNLEDPD